MLNDDSVAKNSPISFWGPARTVAVMAALGLGAVGLRDPARIRGADAPPADREIDPDRGSQVAKTANAQPLDLSWLPPKSAGFIAFKPADIAAILARKPRLVMLNDMIRAELGAGIPRIEAIEQATFEVTI